MVQGIPQMWTQDPKLSFGIIRDYSRLLKQNQWHLCGQTFFFVLAKRTLQLGMAQPFAPRGSPDIYPSCYLRALGTHRPMQD